MTQFHAILKDETKATRQHQITIPKGIWKSMRLEEGTRFQISLTDDRKIVIVPKADPMQELSDREWRSLVKLAHSNKNVTRSFKNTRQALKYLDKL